MEHGCLTLQGINIFLFDWSRAPIFAQLCEMGRWNNPTTRPALQGQYQCTISTQTRQTFIMPFRQGAIFALRHFLGFQWLLFFLYYCTTICHCSTCHYYYMVPVTTQRRKAENARPCFSCRKWRLWSTVGPSRHCLSPQGPLRVLKKELLRLCWAPSLSALNLQWHRRPPPCESS